MKQIVFRKAAIKALKRLPSNVAKTIRSKIDQLARDPKSLANNIVKLQNRPGYRLRVGDWRVIYSEDDDVLNIRDIRPRGSAYKE